MAKYDNSLDGKHLRRQLKFKPNARRGIPSALSIISNECASLAMSPGVRENLEPRRAILRNIGVQKDLSLQRAKVAAWNTYREWSPG
jgi:hypothetical protein